MSSPVSRPPDSEMPDDLAEPRKVQPPSSRRSFFSFVLILVVLLTVLLVLFLSTFPQVWQPATVQSHTVQLDDDSSVVLSDKKDAPPPQIPANQALLLEQKTGISLISPSNGHIKMLATPGYTYNQAVPPILLASGQLLYSGDGIWISDISRASAKRIFALPSGQALTSLVVNDVGTLLTWSTAPAQGRGVVRIYAGTLANFSQVYEQNVAPCPCLRPFSFLHNSTTLLLSDDRGDHNSVYYGIWSLDLAHGPESRPQAILKNNPVQGPLVLSPTRNTLLYSRVKGFVPAPTDGTVPDELASQSYANSLSLIALDAQTARPEREQEILPMQRKLKNSAEYHWATTPGFSPDGRTLLYVLFSSDATQPYDRHNALYMVALPTASNAQASAPQLLASSMADFIELGPWLNNHLVTLYADGSIYILDTESNGLVKVGVAGGDYTRIVGVVKQG